MKLTEKIDLRALAKGKHNLICDFLNKPVKFYAAFNKGRLIELYYVKEEEIEEEASND